MSKFAAIETAIDALKAGKMLVLVDDEHRENEGDLIIAAEFANANSINFMAQYGRGLICLAMAPELVDKLNLPMMASNNQSKQQTAFTLSIGARHGISTGISAEDRATTIQTAIADDASPASIVTPGHIFPLRAHSLGVLKRAGHTEGSVDLMKLAGLKPAAVICEIMNEDGSMARREDLVRFAEKHNLLRISIADLIHYRLKHEVLVNEAAQAKLPLSGMGEFTIHVFHHSIDGSEHIALTKFPLKNANEPALVRMHSECLTGDVFGSLRCDCGWQLQKALEKISQEGGVLLYLRQEGRGIGLTNKIKAYALQEQGLDTVEANVHLGFKADQRDYAVAAQMLKALNTHEIRLMTNNPQKIEALESYGIKVVERIPHETLPTPANEAYLRTKREKLGHLLALLQNPDGPLP